MVVYSSYSKGADRAVERLVQIIAIEGKETNSDRAFLTSFIHCTPCSLKLSSRVGLLPIAIIWV